MDGALLELVLLLRSELLVLLRRTVLVVGRTVSLVRVLLTLRTSRRSTGSALSRTSWLLLLLVLVLGSRRRKKKIEESAMRNPEFERTKETRRRRKEKKERTNGGESSLVSSISDFSLLLSGLVGLEVSLVPLVLVLGEIRRRRTSDSTRDVLVVRFVSGEDSSRFLDCGTKEDRVESDRGFERDRQERERRASQLRKRREGLTIRFPVRQVPPLRSLPHRLVQLGMPQLLLRTLELRIQDRRNDLFPLLSLLRRPRRSRPSQHRPTRRARSSTLSSIYHPRFTRRSFLLLNLLLRIRVPLLVPSLEAVPR